MQKYMCSAHLEFATNECKLDTYCLLISVVVKANRPMIQMITDCDCLCMTDST